MKKQQVKKAYSAPKLTRLGNIGTVTQYLDNCGSGSLVRPD